MKTITCLLTHVGLAALILVGTGFGDGAMIVTSPESLVFTAPPGGANPANQVLRISNGMPGALEWTIEEDCPWLSLNRTSGTTESGYTSLVVVSVDVAGLTEEQYNCQMLVHGTGAANSPKIVSVALQVSNVGLLVPQHYPTIQAAIDAAQDGDEIVVADGVYTGDGNRDIDFKRKAITVRSANGPDNCIIDCQNVAGRRGFYLPDGQGCAAVISGFTIKGGRIESYVANGGGIYCQGYSLLIENCIITGNVVRSRDHEWIGGQGGGLYCAASSVALSSCVISGNGAYGTTQWVDGTQACGGGIYCDASSTLDMVDCVVRDNLAQGGDGGWDGSS
ncbi:MAG: right-handed parallel beta-helix repeat-containing protein, partial [Phycisphaerae bacterium]|nr:right-handed parallel beta-helix repeat-containing protein [Phycisphaerae bacterium]